MADLQVGVLGASSLVGSQVLPQLADAGYQVTAFSRDAYLDEGAHLEWKQLGGDLPAASSVTDGGKGISLWISVAPIWVLLQHIGLLEAYGARRVVVLSSMSRFTKTASRDPREQAIANRLVESEDRFRVWAEQCGVEWIVLRPTLIYGMGRDKNICQIARFIRRFGFFPVFGKAQGLRQPVHAVDVAKACVSVLAKPAITGAAYNISGAETVTYRMMVERVFDAMGRRARVLSAPMWAFRLAVSGLRLLPRYQDWSPAMAERMNSDLVADHSAANRDFGFDPVRFNLKPEDLGL